MLNQLIVDSYLRCPVCHFEESFKYGSNKMVCNSCGFEPKIRFGIPALIKDEEMGIYSDRFLNQPANKRKIKNPHKELSLNFFQRLFFAEVIHFINFIFFSYKLGLKNMLHQKYCNEVEKALCYGWRNYYNLILKAGEIAQFKKMGKYIMEPSLEIGCADSRTTNMIFKNNIESITFGCEYFMDSFLNAQSELSEEMHKLIKHYIGGSIKSLPFRSNIFTSVIMVHIIDHIIHIDECLKEISRILRPGGHLVMTGFSKNTFKNLPGVRIRKIFSTKWSERYQKWRIIKDNPRGNPMKSYFEYDAIGQNIFSIQEWENIVKTHGFKIVDYAFFGKYFSYFKDIEYKGYYNSILLNRFIYGIISEIIEQEKKSPVSEEESTNIILVLKKEKTN
ncbi:MAG: class I SAM-dependent methyltransferase [Candidatus Omnitrophota bacterium]|nr:class I SAM-dependent methyltransferase [Candidatus Omnitrophota bacterium]